MQNDKTKITLYQPASYQIKVPGMLDDRWLDWNGELAVTVEEDRDGVPVTTLIGTLDQAALQEILRRLYYLGLPLISVICVDCV